MDDFVERLWKSLAIMIGGFVFIYVLIASSREKPRGVSLFIYNSMNQLFYWLLIFIAVVAVGAILFFVTEHYSEINAKEKAWLMEEAKRKEADHLNWLQRQRDLEHEQEKEEERIRIKKLIEMEEQQRLVEKKRYLKNRSVEEANKDALKDFL